MNIGTHLGQQDYFLNRHVLRRLSHLPVGRVVLAGATLPVEGAVAGLHGLDIRLLDAALCQELRHVDRLLDLEGLDVDASDTRVIEQHDFWF
jgi:hypothetical protein